LEYPTKKKIMNTWGKGAEEEVKVPNTRNGI
jgi:hypothetical protein